MTLTDSEKIIELANSILPDTDTDVVLNAMLANARALILNRMYPFGYDESMEVPPRYDRIQIQLAVELYTHRGAEGQTSHSENGISRNWPEKSALLNMILPHCGSVIKNA